MKLTNMQIYTYAQKLNSAFQNANIYLPARINFYIQKNKSTILSLGEEIEKARLGIFQQYGENTGNSMITIPEEKIIIAQQELDDLLAIEQEVNILTFSIENLTNDIKFSMEQMEAIMFMIEET